MILGDQKTWREAKKKFGIPDGVSKFSMGAKLDAFAKAEKALEPHEDMELVKLIDRILPILRTYKKDLNDVAADKFKGKNESEQKANAKKAKDHIDHLLLTAETRRKVHEARATPMMQIAKEFPTIDRRYGQLNPADHDEIASFYTDEMRNKLGQPVKTALAQKTIGGKVLLALQEYADILEGVNAIEQGFKPGTTHDQYVEMGKALAKLRPFVK